MSNIITGSEPGGSTPRRSTRPRPAVALVYPPYGPPNLPSLGLALLSAGIKARGYDCRTFYWSYHFARELPGVPEQVRPNIYHLLTQRGMSPWNEWAFMRHALPSEMARNDHEVARELAELDHRMAPLLGRFRASEIIRSIAQEIENILGRMADRLEPFDLIGFGSTFFQNGAALAMAKHIKQRWPQKLVMLGGANCDGEMGRGLMDNLPFLDFVFTGEVDHQVPRFVAALHSGDQLGDIPGLIYRDDSGRVQQGPPAEPLRDLDGLPLPDFDDWLEERKRCDMHQEDHVCLPLESSRGCWWGAKHHCTFCGLNANGMAYRQKSPERFQDEIATIRARYGATLFFMTDNILSTKYYQNVLKWAKQNEVALDFFYEIKANVTREQVAALADAGVTMVQPGIEHFSSKTLTLMRKGVRAIQNLALLKYAAEHGVITVYSILVGFPGEDPNEYGRLLSELPKFCHFRPPMGVIEIEFHRFSPYHNDPEAFGLRLRPHRKYRFIYPFEEAQLARLAYQFEAVGRRTQDLSYVTALSAQVGRWQRSHRAHGLSLRWYFHDGEVVIRDRRPGFSRMDYRLKGFAASVVRAFEEPRKIKSATAEAGRLRAELEPLDPDPWSNAPWHDSAQETASALAAETTCLLATTPIERRAAMELPAVVIDDESVPLRVISFSEAEFLQAPEECLAPLVAAGLLYHEDGWYLNLAVRQDIRPEAEQWSQVQVP